MYENKAADLSDMSDSSPKEPVRNFGRAVQAEQLRKQTPKSGEVFPPGNKMLNKNSLLQVGTDVAEVSLGCFLLKDIPMGGKKDEKIHL